MDGWAGCSPCATSPASRWSRTSPPNSADRGSARRVRLVSRDQARLEVRPETRPRDLVVRWPRSKEPPSTAVSVFNIRAARSAEGDAGDGSHERQITGWAFRPHL